MFVEVPVHAAHVPPNGLVLSGGACSALADGGLAVGDVVETPGGPRTLVSIKPGGALEGWAADGEGEVWRLAPGPRAAERLRVHRSACNVPEGAGYDPVHHTPLRGAPLPAAVLDWLRSRGATAILEDVAWRQDHVALARIALAARERGDRPGPAWRTLGDQPDLGMGPIRTALSALAWVLGFDLRLTERGVQLGLRHQDPVATWSAGPLATAGAFRKGSPVPGGMHDPELVGDRQTLRYAHVALPWPMLPGHLAPVVAEILGTAVDTVQARAVEEPPEGLMAELGERLAVADGPLTLDGTPVRVTDFFWSEVAVVPGAYRRSVRNQGQRVPHGLDGTLHTLLGAVRSRGKLGELHPQLEVELRMRIQTALDAYLVSGPDPGGDRWGWSLAHDLHAILAMDGALVDWGGQGVAMVEPGRQRVGLPRTFESILLQPHDPESVLLLRMPDGVAAVRPELVEGTLIRLPLDVAGALGARTGELVRVVPMVSLEAQSELDALASGVRLSPMVPLPGWLDEVAALTPSDVGRGLVAIARERRLDRCLGPVGSRLFAGILPTPRGEDAHEVERVQRGFALLLQVVDGPGHTMPPGVATKRLDRVEAALGTSLVPELRSLWQVHDGQATDTAPQLLADGEWWRLVPLDPEAVRDGRIPLAIADSGELLDVDPRGRVWRGGTLVTQSVGRLLQLSFAEQQRTTDGQKDPSTR